MKKEKKDYLELNCQNFTERGFNIIINQHKDNDRHGQMGPMKYYGRVHEVKCSPNVLYVSTGLVLSNLQPWYEFKKGDQLDERMGKDSTILFCNPKSSQTLTITGVSKGAASFTIDLSSYNREQVLKFLTDHGVTLENEDVKV